MCFAVMANIFLLEDDKILSKGISIALEKDKHTVTAVYGYMKALQTYQNQRYDTVLKNYPLYCPKCKRETLINAKELHITVIKEPDA